MLVPAALFGALYFSLWGWRFVPEHPILSLNPVAAVLYLVIIVIGMFVHELIHLASAMYFGKISSRDFKFGIEPKTLSPYFHCKVPLEVGVYRKLTAMPGFILGLLPSLIGLISGNPWIMLFGLIFCLGAGGDMLILWLLRNVKQGTMVEDHPSRVGCFIIETDDAA